MEKADIVIGVQRIFVDKLKMDFFFNTWKRRIFHNIFVFGFWIQNNLWLSCAEVGQALLVNRLGTLSKGKHL